MCGLNLVGIITVVVAIVYGSDGAVNGATLPYHFIKIHDYFYPPSKQFWYDDKPNCTNYSAVEDGVACSTCELITGIIQHEIKISNDTIIEVEKIVAALCKQLGTKPAAKECYAILKDIGIIAQMIEKGLEPGEICCRLGFCNTTA